MSKSLKNFISIKEALKVHSARQLRLLFLMQRWDAPSDYKDESMKESKAIEAKFSNFFTNVNAKLRDARHKESESDGQRHFKDAELALIEGLKRAQRLVHDALSDSFNTPRALDALKDLVSATNEYMGQRRDDVDVQAIGMVARYVTRMCRMFGLAPDTDYRTIGWGSLDVDKAGADAADGVGSKEDSILPYLRVLSNFRDQVRRAAISGECDKRTLLDLCDTVRNELLPPLDVMLDDQEDGTALIKFIDSKEWQRQKEEKEAKRREKEQQKLERAKAAEKKRLERLEKGKVAPEE
ncbi:cysteinyl-tRNA synthetase, partial [Spiromyces aspiralis]